jgi:RNA polymerase sigma-70 factor (ECF subfamily)
MTATDFQQKYEFLHDLLFAFAMKLTRNKEDAKDLMQETACRAYQYRDRYKMGTNFKAWMSTIMRNTFINNYRKKKTRKKTEAPIEDFLFAIENKSVSNEANSVIFVNEIKKMLGTLSDTYQAPFLMFFRGYQYMEIAKHLGIPIGTVKSRIFFARKKLKAMIRERYGQDVLAA